ncbi:Low-specificity L-threonine aldolase, partial [Zancudomyces culisetae]
MLQRMATVETGDDVYGEDPSINKLERRMADLCEKEDSLFCTTGTLSNQLGLRSLLTVPPYSVVCDEACHVNVYEASGLAYLSRAQTITIAASNDKYITVDEIKKKIVVDDGDVHCAPTRVISLENTINGV